MGQIWFSLLMIVCIFFIYKRMSAVGILFLEPGKLMLISWGVGIFFLLSGAIIYKQEFSLQAFAVVLLSLVFFSLGAIMGVIGAKSHRPMGDPEKRLASKLVVQTLFLGSVVYILVTSYNLITSPDSILRVGLAGLSDLRAAHWENAEDAGGGASNLLLSIARTSVLLFIMLSIFQARKGTFKLQLIVVIAGAILLTLEGLSKGGRSYLGFTVLYVGAALALNYYRTELSSTYRIKAKLDQFPIRWYHYLGGILFVYFAFIVFPQSRNVEIEGQLLKYLNFRHPSGFGQWVESISVVQGFGWVKTLVFGSGYLSLPITKAVFIIEQSVLPDQYLLGFYNGKFFVRIASLFDSNIYINWLMIRSNLIANEMASFGFNTNPWGTILKDLVIDFGNWGAPFFMFAYGFLAQFWFRRLMHTQRADRMVLAGVIAITCAVSGFFGPFVNNTVAYPLFLMIILLWIASVLRTDIR